jgi:hypothetical protein
MTASYRQTFNANVSLLAKHFKGRIKYWEVWNEENFAKGQVAPVRWVHFSLGANTAVVNRVPPSAKPAYAG